MTKKPDDLITYMDEPIIYLGSPYSDEFLVTRIDRFNDAVLAAAYLISNGTVVYSPIAHSHPIAMAVDIGIGWETWRKIDLTMLAICSELCVLKLHGWEQSTGLTYEIEKANEWNIKITYLSISAVHKWKQQMEDINDK